MSESPEGGFESALADRTPWADHVGKNFDLHVLYNNRVLANISPPVKETPMTRLFKYKVDKRYLPVLLLCACAIQRRRDAHETSFIAKFGFLKTRDTAIEHRRSTRDSRLPLVDGGWPRLSNVDDGLTFGTNKAAGVCVHFRDKVPSALKRRGHSALTVTSRTPMP